MLVIYPSILKKLVTLRVVGLDTVQILQAKTRAPADSESSTPVGPASDLLAI